MERIDLETRVMELSRQVKSLSDQLKLSYTYAQSDAQASLTKCRILLEQLLPEIIKKQGLTPNSTSSINENINQLRHEGNVEQRIITKMHSIRVMANLGAHGEKVLPRDALNTLDNLCDIVQWHFEVETKKPHSLKKIKFIILGVASISFLVLVLVWQSQHQNKISEKDVTQFVKAYQASALTNDINATLEFFAPTVHHNGKIKTKKELREERTSFIYKWYERKYFISSGIIVSEIDDSTFYAKYEETFTAQNTTDDSDFSRGVWQVELSIRDKAGKLTIVALDGKALSRVKE